MNICEFNNTSPGWEGAASPRSAGSLSAADGPYTPHHPIIRVYTPSTSSLRLQLVLAHALRS